MPDPGITLATPAEPTVCDGSNPEQCVYGSALSADSPLELGAYFMPQPGSPPAAAACAHSMPPECCITSLSVLSILSFFCSLASCNRLSLRLFWVVRRTRNLDAAHQVRSPGVRSWRVSVTLFALWPASCVLVPILRATRPCPIDVKPLSLIHSRDFSDGCAALMNRAPMFVLSAPALESVSVPALCPQFASPAPCSQCTCNTVYIQHCVNHTRHSCNSATPWPIF